MSLSKIGDVYPNYKERFFNGENIKNFDVYAGTDTDRKIGNVHDILIDEGGRFRYLVIDTGFWIFGKQVLLPVGRCRLDDRANRIYATGIVSKEQVENLPRYDDDMVVDRDYEDRVRSLYRTPAVGSSASVESSPPVEAAGIKSVSVVQPQAHRENYNYDREPELYQTSDRDHKKLRLYEERLVADKERHKVGEVVIGKHVETESARAAVPVEKEKVVIETTAPSSQATPIPADQADFHDETVARVDVYEESADIHKETVVGQEVNVKKVVDRDTVEASEKVRRERLDVKKQGDPTIQE